jgi:NADPH:quinone reductase
MATMKAAVYDRNGGPDVLRFAEVASPDCPASGVVIRVEAVSIEGGDTFNRSYTPVAHPPHIVGYQAAGEVVEVGPRSRFAVGQKVVTTGIDGSHAEYRAARDATTWPIPDGLGVEEASTVPIPFGTADNCLFAYGHVTKGDTVLIQAGASGVGVAAIQLAKRAGCRVLTTASSDERLTAIEHLGVDHGINYREHDTAEEVMRITGGKGVDLVLDGNGGTTLQSSIACLGWKGRVTLIGYAGRDFSKVDVSGLIAGNRSLIGLALAMEMTTERVRSRVAELLDEVARGELEVLIDRRFPLSDAAGAHAYIESRQAVGRVLLIP